MCDSSGLLERVVEGHRVVSLGGVAYGREEAQSYVMILVEI